MALGELVNGRLYHVKFWGFESLHTLFLFLKIQMRDPWDDLMKEAIWPIQTFQRDRCGKFFKLPTHFHDLIMFGSYITSQTEEIKGGRQFWKEGGSFSGWRTKKEGRRGKRRKEEEGNDASVFTFSSSLSYLHSIFPSHLFHAFFPFHLPHYHVLEIRSSL